MQVIDPGHIYGRHRLDGPGEEIAIYVKREGLKFPGNGSGETFDYRNRSNRFIEEMPFCLSCGHVGCDGECRTAEVGLK